MNSTGWVSAINDRASKFSAGWSTGQTGNNILLARWSGSVHDLSGNGHTLTAVNQAQFSGVGPVSTAMLFDGTNDRFKFTEKPIVLTGSRTLSAWVNLASLTEQSIFGKFDSNTPKFGFLAPARPQNTSDATGFNPDNIVVPPTSTWFHFCFVYDAVLERVQIFYDGHLVYNAGNAASGFGTQTLSSIGGRGSTLYNINGSVDDARIYSIALNEIEVANLRGTPDITISCYGDSTTIGTGDSPNGDSYPIRLPSELSGTYSYPAVIQGGKGGASPEEIADNFVSAAYAHDTDVLILWESGDQTTDIVSQFQRAAQKHSGRTLIVMGIHTLAYDTSTVNTALSTEFGTSYLDIKSFLDGDDYVDNVHLNSGGYDKVAVAVADKIEALLA